MANATPQTIGNELFESVNNLIKEGHYLQKDSTVIKRLAIEARKLMPREPSVANIVLAAISQLYNSPDEVVEHVRIANQLPNDNQGLLKSNSAVALSNAFLYTKAQKYLNLIEEPNCVEMNQLVESALGSLSILQLKKLIDKAKLMKLNWNNQLIELTERAATVLNKYEISDQLVAQYAEVFGTVLHENNLMLKETIPFIEVGDENNNWYPETVFITFRVDADYKKAAQLYKEATNRLITKYGSIPYAVHLSIEPI